jgi:hypothetical protein
MLAPLYASGFRVERDNATPWLLLSLLLLTNIPLVANVVRKGSSMFSSNLVRLGGLAAISAGALLLILDVWGLVLEILGAYPKNFSEEGLTPT